VRRFTVKAHAGKNRLRFTARGLVVGTYRISASTLSGRLVRRATLVVFADSTPTSAEIAAARSANVCASSTRFGAGGDASSSSPSTLGREAPTPAAPGGSPSTGGFPVSPPARPGGVLGSSVQETARAIQPWLVALLAFAIALLALGSAPRLATTPNSRVNDLLARHRPQVVGLGAAAFVAVIITFFLS
jgi:hypothetical protein